MDMDYVARIRRIRESIVKLRNDNYKKHSYQPVTKAYQKRSTRGDNRYDIDQLCEALKLKNSKEMREINIRLDDIFADPNAVRRAWSELEANEKIACLHSYMEKNKLKYKLSVASPQIQELVEMINTKGMTRKTDVIFDEINRIIIKVPILKFNKDTEQCYVANKKRVRNANKILKA